MTENQRKNLITIGKAIRDGQSSVSESYAVGQVMLVTGRTWQQALQGLRLMEQNNALPTGFIKPETKGVLEALTSENPLIEKLISRFDCIPGKTQILEYQPFCKPRPISRELLAKRFSIPEF